MGLGSSGVSAADSSDPSGSWGASGFSGGRRTSCPLTPPIFSSPPPRAACSLPPEPSLPPCHIEINMHHLLLLLCKVPCMHAYILSLNPVPSPMIT
ncbi:unnamed protein product [Periconia digitata]|uniref:Uncharacterized protein n=1 Tax=Periconia digitata TaxID=1303443 RepID=A0A9W4UT44_9PLEO|nr:unnamed protein product [Periconia digitata]